MRPVVISKSESIPVIDPDPHPDPHADIGEQLGDGQIYAGRSPLHRHMH